MQAQLPSRGIITNIRCVFGPWYSYTTCNTDCFRVSCHCKNRYGPLIPYQKRHRLAGCPTADLSHCDTSTTCGLLEFVAVELRALHKTRHSIVLVVVEHVDVASSVGLICSVDATRLIVCFSVTLRVKEVAQLDNTFAAENAEHLSLFVIEFCGREVRVSQCSRRGKRTRKNQGGAPKGASRQNLPMSSREWNS